VNRTTDRPRQPRSKTGYIVGLDLGQTSDYTAISVIRRTESGQTEAHGRALPMFDCQHLMRFERFTPYPEMVAAVTEMMSRRELHRAAEIAYVEERGRFEVEEYQTPKLIVDATGVGRPVVEMFIDAKPDCDLRAMTITGGHNVTEGRWHGTGIRSYHTPKRELVGAVQAGLSSGRLKFVPSLPLAETLRKELLNFRIRMTLAGSEQFEAGPLRENPHDDLVLATAMAVWAGANVDPGFRILQNTGLGMRRD
jgi:hypothetical protein